VRHLNRHPDMGLFYQYLPEGRCEPHSARDHSWWCQPRGKPLPPVDLPQNAVPSAEATGVFTDADYGNDKDSCKSICDTVITWYGPIAWFSRKQSIVTTSSCEAELVAAATGCKQGVWFRKLLSEPLIKAPEIQQYCYNAATIALIKNETAAISGRSKHIYLQFKFVHD
jgi:hypothetical protein